MIDVTRIAGILLPALLVGVSACGRVAADDAPSPSPSAPLGPAVRDACVVGPSRPTRLLRLPAAGATLSSPISRGSTVYAVASGNPQSTLYELPALGQPRTRAIGVPNAWALDVFGGEMALSWAPPGASPGSGFLSVFDVGTASLTAAPNPPGLPNGTFPAVFDDRGSLYWTATRNADPSVLMRKDAATGVVSQWAPPAGHVGSYVSTLLADGHAVVWVEETSDRLAYLYRAVSSFAEAAAPIATLDTTVDYVSAMIDGALYYATTVPNFNATAHSEIRELTPETGTTRTLFSWEKSQLSPEVQAVDRDFVYWQRAEDDLALTRAPQVLYRTAFATGITEVVFDAVDPENMIGSVTLDDCNVMWTTTGHDDVPAELFVRAKTDG